MLHTLGIIVACVFAALTALTLFAACMAMSDNRDNPIGPGLAYLGAALVPFCIGYALAWLCHAQLVFFQTAVVTSGVMTVWVGVGATFEGIEEFIRNRTGLLASVVWLVLSAAWGGILLVLWVFCL